MSNPVIVMAQASKSSSEAKTKQSDLAAVNAVDQFEASLSELETLIGQMESGSLSLDDSVKGFERGMALYESCKQALDQAQLKVELLLKGASEMSAHTRVPFNRDSSQA
jgi:exodeoxyribonuclease VII small subunit